MRAVRRGLLAGGVALLSTEADQLSAHESMVTLKQLAPGTIPELRRPLGRADDVSEENRSQDALRGGVFRAHGTLPANRQLHEAAGKPSDAQRPAGVRYGLVAHVPAGPVVDLLQRVLDDAQHDHDPAPRAQSPAHHPDAALEVQALRFARRQQPTLMKAAYVARPSGIGRQLEVLPVLCPLVGRDGEVEVALVRDQLQVTGAVRLAVDDPDLRASYGSR